jgi:5-methylcytosine-specific restriction endonuclease McrA
MSTLPTPTDNDQGSVPYGKRTVPSATRQAVAIRVGAIPGGGSQAVGLCAQCGQPGRICWRKRMDGKPSAWVHFAGLELDHIHPERLGGGDGPENIQLLCRPCNRRKGWKV